MLFAGQGTQWVGCGKALYETNQLFRSVLDTIDEQWRQYSPVSLRKACFEGIEFSRDIICFMSKQNCDVATISVFDFKLHTFAPIESEVSPLECSGNRPYRETASTAEKRQTLVGL